MGGTLSNIQERKEWISKVKTNGFFLEKAPDHIKNDKKIVLLAVEHGSGYALKSASNELQNDVAFVIQAVKRNRKVFQHLSPKLRNNKKVVAAAEKGALDAAKKKNIKVVVKKSSRRPPTPKEIYQAERKHYGPEYDKMRPDVPASWKR